MPLYDFKCDKCKKTEELLCSSSVICVPHEGCKGTLHKQLSSPGGFVLKGDGFYKPSRG